jgi:uncharacterized protein YabE (DUF348 family)
MWDEDDKVKPSLESRIKQKIIDLQDKLLRHAYEDGFTLDEKDLIRYSAMVEVLKAMLN